MAMNTPWSAHETAGHEESRVSPNGVDTIIECDSCRLAWLMPLEDGTDNYPVTLWHYYSRKKDTES